MATEGYKNFKWYKPKILFDLIFIPIRNPFHRMDASAIWVRKGIIGGPKPIKFKIEKLEIDTVETQNVSIPINYDVHDNYKVYYEDLYELKQYFNDIYINSHHNKITNVNL